MANDPSAPVFTATFIFVVTWLNMQSFYGDKGVSLKDRFREVSRCGTVKNRKHPKHQVNFCFYTAFRR